MVTMLWYWLLVLAGGSAVVTASAGEIDWKQLKDQLKSRDNNKAVDSLVKNWTKRPPSFLSGIKKEAWSKIIPHLSARDIGAITPEEFKSSKAACEEFAGYLPRISNAEALPKIFRSTFYEKLSDVETRSALEHMIEFIPAEWIEKDASKIVETFSLFEIPPFKSLNEGAISELFKNHNGVCRLLTFNHLAKLGSKLKHMTPECMAVIKDSGERYIGSWITNYLPDDCFSKYNGPLPNDITSNLTSRQLQEYGSLIDGNTIICQSLDLHHLSDSAIKGLSARCLYGYLSEKRNRGLARLWRKIPVRVLSGFSFVMKSAWANIHQAELGQMRPEVRRVILSARHFCHNLDSNALNAEIVGDMSANCLHALLSAPGGPKSLGSLWENVSIEFQKNFTIDMLRSISNVDFKDFNQMPAEVLQLILGSEAGLVSLPKPIEEIKITHNSRDLILTKGNFLTIARIAPSIAAQLLKYVESLPSDILASCSGEVIRSFEYVTESGQMISWVQLFEQLEREKESFAKLIKLMSTKTSHHFCSTILTLEEYLTLKWLHNNMTLQCRQSLPFDLDDVSVLLQAPELTDKVVPWKKMLKVYTNSNWIDISKTGDLLFSRLSTVCEFWVAASQKHPRFIKEVDSKVLRHISPHCVRKLSKVIKDHCDVVIFLQDEAFSLYQAGELPCKLNYLSPSQLSNLSKFNTVGVSSPTSKERSRHALSKITLKELKSLNVIQFMGVLRSQWNFITEDIRSKAVESQLELAISRLNTFAENFQPTEASDEEEPSNSTKEMATIVATMEFYVFLRAIGQEVETGNILELAKVLEAFKSSSVRQEVIHILTTFSWSQPLVPALFENAAEFRGFLQNGPIVIGVQQRQIEPAFNHVTGFDRKQILQFVHSLDDGTALMGGLFVYNMHYNPQSAIRILIDQILSDIKRDLVKPVGAKDDERSSEETDESSSSSCSDRVKFSWGISRDAGLVTGLAIGAAIKLDITLPFELDRDFYNLIVDSSDESIDKYYKNAYQQDISDFKKHTRKIINTKSPLDEKKLCKLTRPDRVRFTRLSTFADPEEARNDLMTKTNVKSCSKKDGFKTIEQDNLKAFLQNYQSAVQKKVLAEFKAFIHELVRGISLVFPIMKKLESLSTFDLSPFAKFLPELLNLQSSSARKTIIDRVEFQGDESIQSFSQNQTILASEVYSAFVRSLDRDEFSSWMTLWTGASTASPEFTEFKVDFISSDSTRLIKVNFCQPSDLDDDEPSISPSYEQYLDSFTRFVKEIPTVNPNIKPDCNPDGVEILVKKRSLGQRPLEVYLQPVQALFNSLYYILKNPLIPGHEADSTENSTEETE